jgi:protein-S-isoprenylcysteine O-methyltransferase
MQYVYLYLANTQWYAAFWISYWAWILMEIWIFSRDRKKAAGQKKDRGSVFFIGLLISAGNTAMFLAPHLWRWARIDLPPEPLFWTAIGLAWTGILLRVWSVLTLGRHFRTVVHILDDHKLVTSGPYRVLRHPSYTGGLMTLMGIGMAFGNWISLAAATGSIFIGYGVRILIEEAALKKHFGEAWAAHKKRTWAFIPFVW